MKVYDLSKIKRRITNSVAELVPQYFKRCKVTCTIEYNDISCMYRVRVCTKDSLDNHISFGYREVKLAIFKVFDESTGYLIKIVYNHNTLLILRDTRDI